MSLREFRATRSTTRAIPDELRPSDAPASEEYSYEWLGGIWWIRCEAPGRYVFDWTHPCEEWRPNLAKAESALWANIKD